MNDEKIRVAIVEDISGIRDSLRILINGSDGFECIHTFQDAETAIAEMPSTGLDVILMDISLPRMNGIECMTELRKRIDAGTQFMICSVLDDDDNIFNALESGAMGYILKRTAPAQILEAISDLHAGGSPMSSEIARRIVGVIQKKRTPSEEAEALTAREKEILDLLSQGYLYKEIADNLCISKLTVKKHIHNIYEKLQVQNRTEAINKARRK